MDDLTAIRQQIRDTEARPWYRDKARHLQNLRDAEQRLLAPQRQRFSYRRGWWAKAS